MHNTMNASPLYLHHGSAQKLDLDGARRLRIERKDLPERLIPMHHVSRVVCSSSLDISARALMACLQSGIPLAILKANGETLGWCMGSRRKETSLRQLLTFALDDIVWPVHYTSWLQHQFSAAAMQNLLQCSVPSTATARFNPRAALCNAHFRKHKVACAQLVNALAMLAQHELAAHLSRETGDAQMLSWYRPGLNLMQDLGGIIGLHAHTDLHHASALPAADKLQAWAVRHYERHAAHWQQRISQLTFEFEQFLRAHWL
jgi:hypothetical protein